MTKINLDIVDKQILKCLQEDGRIANTDLADKVRLTPAPCLRRVKRLEKEQIIQSYEAKLNAKKLGLDLMIFVTVSLDKQDTKLFESFTELMSNRPEVQECHLILGEGDFLIKVRVKDLDAYQDFLLKYVTGSSGVRNVNSAIVLQTNKESSYLSF